jgi:hypothetical protein
VSDEPEEEKRIPYSDPDVPLLLNDVKAEVPAKDADLPINDL